VSAGWQKEGKGRASAAAAEQAALPLRLERPLGQGEALARQVRAARRLVLPHGFVVEGERGGGKSTIVRWLTAALLCPSELDADEPCAVCRVCTLVANDAHPDVHVVRRAHSEQERKDEGGSYHVVTIDQVRATEERLARHAVEGRARIAVFGEADHLSEEAQNALLKTLEEPGVHVFLLLEATAPENLLGTIRSRVQRLKALPLPAATVHDELFRRLPAASARFGAAVELADGSLGQALWLCSDRGAELQDVVRRVLADPQGLRPAPVVRAVLGSATEKVEKRRAAGEFLSLLRRAMQRRRDELAADAASSYGDASLEPWTSWLESTLAAERDLELFIPEDQVLTACLLSFAES
jgi:DNA polymerase III subunit delta'